MIAEHKPGSMKGLIAVYLEWAEGYYRKPSGRPTREAWNLRDAVRPILTGNYAVNDLREEPLGDLKPDGFRPVHLRRSQKLMIDAGLCRRTINARINRIRRMFRWAVSMELCRPRTLTALEAVPPLKRGRTPARESPGVHPVAWATVEATFALVRPIVADMIRLAWWTGMRPGELCVMRSSDVDLTIDPGVWIYRPAEHKTEHYELDRLIPLGPKAQAILRPYLDRARWAGAFRFVPEERLFPFTVATFRQTIRRACVRGGLEVWKPNQLRHAAATRLRREVGLDASRVILGHTSPATTEIYAETDRAKARDLMRKYG